MSLYITIGDPGHLKPSITEGHNITKCEGIESAGFTPLGHRIRGFCGKRKG